MTDKAGNRLSVTNKINGAVTGYGSNLVNQYTRSAADPVTMGATMRSPRSTDWMQIRWGSDADSSRVAPSWRATGCRIVDETMCLNAERLDTRWLIPQN